MKKKTQVFTRQQHQHSTPTCPLATRLKCAIFKLEVPPPCINGPQPSSLRAVWADKCFAFGLLTKSRHFLRAANSRIYQSVSQFATQGNQYASHIREA